jgi:hypothetical protein
MVTRELAHMGERMTAEEIAVWEEDGAWLGYWRSYPAYWTQGDSFSDLLRQLGSLRADIESGVLAGVP